MPSIIDELVALRQTVNQIAGWPDDGNVTDIKKLAAKVIVDRIIENSEHTTGARLRRDVRKVAQWQARVKFPVWNAPNNWVNVTEKGAITIRDHYSDDYELRALYEE